MTNFELEQELVSVRGDVDSLLSLLTDIRFALGDNGLRMQDDLVKWCRQLRDDRVAAMMWLEIAMNVDDPSRDIGRSVINAHALIQGLPCDDYTRAMDDTDALMEKVE